MSLSILMATLLINPSSAAEPVDPIKVDWSFKGITGKFDRASLQ